MTKRRRQGRKIAERPVREHSRRTRPWSVALIAVGAAALAFVLITVWNRKPPGGPATALSPSRDNILLVTLDTARADHFGAYGYARARTRHIDRLAAEGVRFEKAFTTAPITLTAHASLLTGLYPFEHGVRNNGNFYLDQKYRTLADILRESGYRTGAFVSAFVLDRRYGLGKGFEVYDDRMQGPRAQVVSLEAERRGDHTAEALSAWLQATARPNGAPFFAWLHLYDPHEPYYAPPPFRDAFLDAPYDGEIAFTDAIVASILDKLRALGVADRTIVAIVGDHGESLGDHGEETHSMLVYDAAIHIPMIVWRPGRVPAGVVVPDPVRITDLAPTLLDLVGAPPLGVRHGHSLVPLFTQRPSRAITPESIYAETYLPQFYLNWSPLRTLRDERWKFIDAPRPELYDVVKDPGETRNLYGEQPRTASAMAAALRQLTGGTSGEMKTRGLDRETIEKLAALGYVGAGVEPAPSAGDLQRRDPKDVIGLFNRLRRANSAVRDRRFADALPILQEVLKADPRNAFAQLVLGSAYMGMEQYPKAISQYAKYLELVPTSSYAHQWMAICYVRMGEQDAALREAAAALALDPRAADARILRGGIFASRGDYKSSLEELRAAVASDPAKPMVRLDLAKVLAEAGQRDEARKEYEAILAIQPDYSPALTGLGTLEAGAGRLPEAAALFRRALAIEPAHEGTRFDLARVLEQQGLREEARTEYRKVAEDERAPAAVRAAARQRLAR